MNWWLIARITFVLFALSFLSNQLQTQISRDAFLVNLTTELLGITVSVLCVGLIIKKHLESKDKEAIANIRSSIRSLINMSIVGIHSSIGGEQELTFKSEASGLDEWIDHLAMNVVKPRLKEHIINITNESWTKFCKKMHQIERDVNSFLVMFNQNLDPVTANLVFSILKRAKGILLFEEAMKAYLKQEIAGDRKTTILNTVAESADSMISDLITLGESIR